MLYIYVTWGIIVLSKTNLNNFVYKKIYYKYLCNILFKYTSNTDNLLCNNCG